MQVSKEEYLSDKKGFHEYLVIKELPSKFRLYDIDRVYVRGLYFEEALSLSKYVGSKLNLGEVLESLCNIYADVIRGVDLEDLEPYDFFALVGVSTIWTQENHRWKYQFNCNYRDKDISESEDYVGRAGNKFRLLEQKKSEIAFQKKNRCGSKLEGEITLDDIEFKDDIFEGKSIEFTCGDKELSLEPLRIRDIIEGHKRGLKGFESSKIISLASIIKNKDMTFDDKVKFVSLLELSEGKNLMDKFEELDLSAFFFTHNCQKCGRHTKILIQQDELKSYP